MFVTFVDYEKAFDSIDRVVLLKLLRHCGSSLRNISFSYRRAMRNAPVELSTIEYFLSCLKC